MSSSMTFSPHSASNRATSPALVKLRENLAKATAVNTTHKTAEVYADISNKAWALEGYAAARDGATASVLFYTHQHQIVSHYQAKLENMIDLSTEFTRQSYHTPGMGLSTPDSVEIIQQNARRFASDLVHQLSTFDPVHGYLFSGASTNQPPFKEKLLKDLNDPAGPQMSRDDIKTYLLNGTDPKAQKHFILYGLEVQTEALPLLVTDFLGVFEQLHDMLSLPMDAPFEALRDMPNHLRGMVDKLHTSTLATAHFLTSFESAKQDASERLAFCQTRFEDEVMVDPIEAAMGFQEKARVLEVYLNAMMLDLSALQKFRERAMSVMGI